MITPALGPQLRAILDSMDADVALALADLGLVDYRTRFSSVVRRVLARSDEGRATTIRDLAEAMGVTHSAASQTVGEMARRGWVALTPGADDARQRVVTLTERALAMRGAIDAEWEATEAAVAALDEELPYSLSRLLDDLETALARRRLRDRIADAARDQLPPGELRRALGRES